MTECKWPGCEKRAVSRQFCSTHLKRARKVNDFDAPWIVWTDGRRNPPIPCRWPQCDGRKHEGRGLCSLHWQRAKRVGDWDTPWEHWTPSTCQGCGESFLGRNRRQKHCSDGCAVTAWKRLNAERARELDRRHSGRRRARILATTVSDFTETDVRMMYGDDCYLCGERINFKLKWPHIKSPSLDHVVPLSRGGTHTLDNVAMTHWGCNNRKNARQAELLPTPTLIAPPP